MSRFTKEQIGDEMQSSLSRIIEHITQRGTPDPGYETRMAVLEGNSAIKRWTELRRQDRVEGGEVCAPKVIVLRNQGRDDVGKQRQKESSTRPNCS